MADPGWYKDRTDHALARWFDGDVWTEHTIVIADQPEGVLPPPPAGWRPKEPEPEPWTPPAWTPPAYVPPPTPEPEPEPEPEIVAEVESEPEPEPEPEAPVASTPTLAIASEPMVPPAPAAEGDSPERDAEAQLGLFELPPVVRPEPEPAAEPEPVAVVAAPIPIVHDDDVREDVGHGAVDAPEAGERPEPGPASDLELLAPQGVQEPDGPSSSPTFDAPSYEDPPENRFAALRRGLRRRKD